MPTIFQTKKEYNFYIQKKTLSLNELLNTYLYTYT